MRNSDSRTTDERQPMAPRKKVETAPDIHMGNAHRYMLPLPEVCGALVMAANCIQDGMVEAYRNKRNGGLMLSFTCPDCDTHHPLIEIHSLDESLDDNDRFILQVRGCMPYGLYLETSGGMLHQADQVHEPSRKLVKALSANQLTVEETTVQEIFEDLPIIATALMEGDASFALDLETGRTAVGFECDDC